jgi:hypothetical protein
MYIINDQHETRLDVIQATLKYKNNGPEPMLIYKWGVPGGELEYPLFKVTQNGERAKYLGRMVKRQNPQP